MRKSIAEERQASALSSPELSDGLREHPVALLHQRPDRNGAPRGNHLVRNTLYYRVKPWLPLFLRLTLRRWLARWKRPHVGNVWPIMPGSEVPPYGWSGWPEGKRFAVVLTHDVEGVAGMERSLALMELEKAAGFRSSFNFVPEGICAVSPEIRAKLETNGFEVGVHDLKHDGFLYQSRKCFKANAERINSYLKEWNATGFRSGFMLHNLSWVEDLNVLYDASTFDTDPFEPQPDGVETIFPFWVPGRDGRGFVELPYTLIQDFNLFVVLQEQTIDIWTRKLDWIAAHGGMALLIVHPDYVSFAGARRSHDEFPASRYQEFLAYIKTRYAGQYLAGPAPRSRRLRSQNETHPQQRPMFSMNLPQVAQTSGLLYRRPPACGLRASSRHPTLRAAADCKSAIQQTGGLRYSTLRRSVQGPKPLPEPRS